MTEDLYCRVPVPLRAVQWHQHDDHALVKPFSANHPAFDAELSCCARSTALHGWISNGRGGEVVCPGDWVITGPNREIGVVRPGVFTLDYETYPPKTWHSNDCTCRCPAGPAA